MLNDKKLRGAQRKGITGQLVRRDAGGGLIEFGCRTLSLARFMPPVDESLDAGRQARRYALSTVLVAAGFFTATPIATAQVNGAVPVGPKVAITFDDLPYMAADLKSAVAARDAIKAQRRIVAALQREHAPATGFVNEDKVLALGPIGPRLLAAWNTGLLELGNHGYSHFDSNTLDLASIEREIEKGEATIRPMAAAANRPLTWFRFPYNHVGDTDEKRLAIERFLTSRGYRIAASTIDTSDYIFNAAYERAVARHDKAMMKRIEGAYIDFSRTEIAYYDALDRQIFGRNVPAIMLIHANRLNAAVIERLLDLFKLSGYRFVSLSEAEADPVYAKLPAYATKFGPMWGYRWARERQLKVNGRLEQEPPDWIGAYSVAATP